MFIETQNVYKPSKTHFSNPHNSCIAFYTCFILSFFFLILIQWFDKYLIDLFLSRGWSWGQDSKVMSIAEVCYKYRVCWGDQLLKSTLETCGNIVLIFLRPSSQAKLAEFMWLLRDLRKLWIEFWERFMPGGIVLWICKDNKTTMDHHEQAGMNDFWSSSISLFFSLSQNHITFPYLYHSPLHMFFVKEICYCNHSE